MTKNRSAFAISCVLGMSGMQDSYAQSATEHHVWQDKRSFAPYSRTAEAITGKIRLTGNKDFATVGSKMSIIFANGKKVQLTSVGGSYMQWDDTSANKVTAEVFKISKDPGKLLNGNTLCGDKATYVVFSENRSFGSEFLSVAVFSSRRPPKDINSPGLCATLNYIVN